LVHSEGKNLKFPIVFKSVRKIKVKQEFYVFGFWCNSKTNDSK